MSTSRRSCILRRTRVGGILSLTLVLMLWLAAAPWGVVFVALVGAVLASLGVVEARRMTTLPDPRSVVGALGAIWVGTALVIATGWRGFPLSPPAGAEARHLWSLGLVVGASLFIAAGAALPLRGDFPRRILTILWLAVPLPLLGLVRRWLGWEGVAALVVLAKVGDIAAYYGGQALAGPQAHHPFPHLSPGKTTIGCVCSLVVTTLCGASLTQVGWLPAAPSNPWLGALVGALAGALVNLAAQAGDLLESAAKRRAGVKDSGSWFGPSGGMLDLVDSLLLAVPVAALAWPWLLAG